jgi:glutamate synthase domain-containing protein 2
MCSNDVHIYDEEGDLIRSDDLKCVGCHFCEEICPTGAITIRRNQSEIKENYHWKKEYVYDIIKQAETGGVILTGMGCDKLYKNYFDHILLNASQVTNPSIDPLREPMELKTFIGKKPDKVEYNIENGKISLKTEIPPQLELETPIIFTAMSFGSISLNALKSLAIAAKNFGTYWNTGEGGLPEELYPYADRCIVQVASGRFGVNIDYLERAAAIEIKIGQGAKPGIGGHLPGEKVSEEISRTRMIPESTDALSPAPHHDIYSIEDLKQLIFALKEATQYKKPVGVKIAAVHNVAPIASGIVRAGADYVAIDGIRGGTGAAPKVIRDNVD